MTHAIINKPRAIWLLGHSFIQHILWREAEGETITADIADTWRMEPVYPFLMQKLVNQQEIEMSSSLPCEG